MIVFDLSCPMGHTFEGWFGSSEDYAAQQARGLVACPQCGSAEVTKAPMAPAVGRKGNQQVEVRPPAAPQGAPAAVPRGQAMANAPLPEHVVAAMTKLAAAQAKALEHSTWVGRDFADASRAMHYGEREQALIHGEATPHEARDLMEEGIAVAPLPFPVAPPEEIN